MRKKPFYRRLNLLHLLLISNVTPAAQIPVAPNANSLPTATAINPLLLTPAQIRALQTHQPNSSFFKS